MFELFPERSRVIGAKVETGAPVLLTVSVLARLNSLFVIPLAPLIIEKGRQSIILHYISRLPCIDTSGLEKKKKVGASVLFAMHLIMECSWNICIFHWVPAKRTVSHWRYELMIKWHRETWWCAKTMKTGGTRLWGSSLLVSCFYVCKDAHSERPFVHPSVSICAFVPTCQPSFASYDFPFLWLQYLACQLSPSFLPSSSPSTLIDSPQVLSPSAGLTQ